MHVKFIEEEQTFRWSLRTDGQPLWRTALTPYKGTNTLSPFVALAARAGMNITADHFHWQ